MRRVNAFSVVFFLFFIFCYAAGAESTSTNADNWRIGVFEFLFRNPPDGLGYLKNSIPLYILNAARQYSPVHELSKEELRLRFLKDKEKKIISIRKELSSLRVKKDSLFLDGDFEDKDLESINSSITKKKKELMEIENSMPETSGKSALPVLFVPEKGLNSIPDLKLDTVPLLKGLDFALYGEIEVIDKWIYVSVYTYNYITSRRNLVYGKLVDPSGINSELPVMADSIKRSVSGKNPPVLIVKGDPPGAYYNLGGGPDYLAGYPEYGIEAGRYTVSVHKEGYYPYTAEVDLHDGKTTEISYTLEKKKTGFIVVSSFPAGADLYLDSWWVGKTPVILEDPVLPSYAELVKEGYSGEKVMIGDSPGVRNYSFSLSPEKIDRDMIMEHRRNKFYDSFGAFIVSLVIPVVSYGISSDYGYAYNNSLVSGVSEAESDRLMSSSALWYNVYMGGVFLSTSLFVNMVVNLYSYISLYQ